MMYQQDHSNDVPAGSQRCLSLHVCSHKERPLKIIVIELRVMVTIVIELRVMVTIVIELRVMVTIS